MWNFTFAIPSLLVILIITGYYISLPRIPIRKHRTFMMMVIVESCVISFDILSSYADSNHELFSIGVLYLLNGAYFVFFMLRAYLFYMFTLGALRLDPNSNKVKSGIVALPMVIAVLLSVSCPLTGAIFSIDKDGYHSGKLYNIVYVILVVYQMLSFYLIIRHSNRVRRRRESISVAWYNAVLVTGTIVRYVFPTYLLMDTFCLIAVIIIYLSFENPDFYLEERSCVFNSKGLREYLEETCVSRKYKMFGLIIHNYYDVREIYGTRQMDKGVALISNYLYRVFKDYKVFYYRSGRFVILGHDEMDPERMRNILNDRFRYPWKANDAELYLEVGYAYIEPKPGDDCEAVLNIMITSLGKVEKSENFALLNIGEEAVKEAEKTTETKKALEYAIDNDKVEPFLQPIVSSKDGSLSGAEVLARVRDQNGELIPPGLFIPIAEKNGRISELGEMIFEKTCKFLKENDIEKMGLKWLNVNLSPIQFMRADLNYRLTGIAKKYGIDPSMIHLEITEESMIDENLLEKQMQSMLGNGFFFVLDDYGSGYSNIVRLRKCPFINIKIDMSLVWDYCKAPGAILPNMIDTFKRIGFTVTAEGIEDDKMANMMRDIGCDYLQGYHYSKPLPMDEFVKKYS